MIAAQDNLLCPDASVAVTLGADFSLTSVFIDQPYARRLYVGTGGTVVAQKQNDAAALSYLNVPSGSYLDGLWIKVSSTGNGTTASNIIAER